jgi:hypothetical protein
MYSFITTSGPALASKDKFVVRSHNMRLCRQTRRKHKRKSSNTPLPDVGLEGLGLVADPGFR